MEKSRVYFSANIDADRKEELCGKLGIQSTTTFGKYLGFPIKHNGARRNQFNFVLEKMMERLAGWKTKYLSFAGRAVLVKAVMSAISNYVMQGSALPAHLCEKLDKVNRDFLWGSACDKRKLHLVGWNKIIKSKEEGGLGIQTSKAKNIALLAKLNWRMFHEKESLWAKVILRKYCSNARRHSVNPDKLPSSPNWKAIMAGYPIFAKGIGWSIGNGEKIRVWQDS